MVTQRNREFPVRLSTVIGEDRKLVIELPADVPTGPAQIDLVVHAGSDTQELTLEEARERMRAAGRLSTVWKPPEGAVILSDEELWALGEMPPDAPPSEQLVREDRGE